MLGKPRIHLLLCLCYSQSTLLEGPGHCTNLEVLARFLISVVVEQCFQVHFIMIAISLRADQGTIVWVKLFMGQSLMASTMLLPLASFSASSISKKLRLRAT